MDEDEIQAQASKFPRIGNGRNDSSNKIGPRGGGGGSGEQQHPIDGGGTTNRFHTWHHSSRIIRVSRASGGKDRHSKVMTSKGLRDRRVRLSVATAIQFYDLQDRLGVDQPSKAVEWLIKSASDAISELPSLNNTFPDTPKQPSNVKRAASVGAEQGFDSAELEIDGKTNYHNQQQQQQHNNNQSQNLSLSKSACSSNSETSKGSGLTLSRPDVRVNRVKARERARERTAKEKENEPHNNIAHHVNVNNNPISQTSSFTELLTGGISNAVPTTTSPNNNASIRNQNQNQWCSTAPMDYFTSGLLGPSSSSRTNTSGFSQFQLGHSLPEAMQVSLSPFNLSGGDHNQNHSSDQQLQHHFSFIPDHMMPAVVTSSSSHHQHHHQPSHDYNLNFTISPGLAGYNRGTLQSNSPSHMLPHHNPMQRFSSTPIDGSTVPFFIGAAAAAAPTMENNNHQQQLQFSPIFDGRGLQLCYGDGSRHSDQKGKGKN